MNSGKIIAHLREEKGWSQTDLADNSSVSRVMIGKYERGEAVPSIEKAIRLNPFPRNWYFDRLGTAYRLTGRYDEAIAAYQKALKLSPNSMVTHLGLTIAYTQLGRDEEARAHAAEVLKISPEFSLDRFAKKIPFKNQAENELVINALRKAGLK